MLHDGFHQSCDADRGGGADVGLALECDYPRYVSKALLLHAEEIAVALLHDSGDFRIGAGVAGAEDGNHRLRVLDDRVVLFETFRETVFHSLLPALHHRVAFVGLDQDGARIGESWHVRLQLAIGLVQCQRAGSSADRLHIHIRHLAQLPQPFEHHGPLRFHSYGVDVARRGGDAVLLRVCGGHGFRIAVVSGNVVDLLPVGGDLRDGGGDCVVRHEDGGADAGHGEVFAVGGGRVACGGDAVALHPVLLEDAGGH